MGSFKCGLSNAQMLEQKILICTIYWRLNCKLDFEFLAFFSFYELNLINI